MLEAMREHTRFGGKELGAIIDQVTGEVLFMREGTQRRVVLDPDILRSQPNVVPVHSHNEELAFSPRDWVNFLVEPNVTIDLVVTPHSIYSLEKTAALKPIFFKEGTRDVSATMDGEGIEEYGKRRFSELEEDQEFLSRFETPSEVAQEITEIINRELAELFGVRFTRHDL